MDPDQHALTCHFELPGGRRVEVGMTVTEEPLFPTPNEADVERQPRLDEWPDIIAKLARLDFTPVGNPKPKATEAN